MSPSGSRRALRLGRDRRGATALEFAVIGTIFITLLLGVVELGRYYFTVQSLRTVAAEAARAYLIRSNLDLIANPTRCQPVIATVTPADLQVSGRTPILAASRLTISAPVFESNTPLPTPAPTCTTRRVRANVSYTFNFVVPFLPAVVPTLTATAFMDFP